MDYEEIKKQMKTLKSFIGDGNGVVETMSGSKELWLGVSEYDGQINIECPEAGFFWRIELSSGKRIYTETSSNLCFNKEYGICEIPTENGKRSIGIAEIKEIGIEI